MFSELAKIMARRKELYEKKHPEARRGDDRKSIKSKQVRLDPTPERFDAATAAAIGKVERVVHLDVQRGTEIVDEGLSLLTRTRLDNTKYLNDLMRTPKAEQVARVERDLSNPPRGCYGSVRAGIQMKGHDLFARRLSVRCFR